MGARRRRALRLGWATRLAAGLAAALCLAPASEATAAGPNPAMEYAVKATYLYKFAPFVEWPANAFPSPTSPLYLCVLGDDPFDGTLDTAVSGQKVDRHPVVVLRMQKIDGGTRCHILYLAPSRAQSGPEALHSIRGRPVLTVTEQGQGPGGAVIQFVLKDNRVRFDIDTTAAAANGMTISSKLLGLANAVKAGS